MRKRHGWIPILAAILVTGFTACGEDAVSPDPPYTTVQVRDVDFEAGRYFFLSDPDSAEIPRIDFASLQVFLDDNSVENNIAFGAEPAHVVIDATAPSSGPSYQGTFHRLEGIDYQLLNTDIYFFPIIRLETPLAGNETLAVAYRDTVNGIPRHVGVTLSDTLLLKMVRPSRSTWGGETLTRSPWAPLRRYELKNVYDLGARNIRPEEFYLWIARVTAVDSRSTQANYRDELIEFLQILGLDQRDNATQVLVPDGLVDPQFIDYEEGLLFFPDLRPFDPSLVDVQGHVNPPAPGRWRTRSWPRTPGVARPDTLGWDQDLAGNPIRSPLADEQTVPELYDLREDRLLTLQQQITRFSIFAVFNVN